MNKSKLMRKNDFSKASFSKLALVIFAVIFMVIGSYLLFFSHATTISGDINGDSTVNITDLSLLLSSYGSTNRTTCVTNTSYTCDLSSPPDNTINVFDLSMLLSNWGKTAVPVPTVTLSANPQSITVGQSSTLTWNSTNATSCTASGGWSGTQNTSGSVTVTPTASTTYSLSCTGAGGSASASAVVTATASGVSVGANPLGPATPTGGWSVEYADAFGSPSKYNGGADNTYWPDSWIGDTGNENPSNPSSEMDYYNPSKVAVDSQGLRLDCSYTGASTFPYTCGEINIGLGGNNHPTTYPGYQFFSYQPGQGDTWALQITTQFPPTTGEADPGFWSSDATWKWEWDMFEGWGYWNNASNWCGDGITDPTWISSGSIQKQVWSNPCSTYGFDPSQGVHTYTTVMLPNNSFEEYVDGKYIHTLSGPVTGAQDMGGIWLQYSLRNVLWSGNNDTNFKSGTRSMHIRSVAVYENKSANHAHTSNGGLIAPGTTVK
jgi:hypothetical protein